MYLKAFGSISASTEEGRIDPAVLKGIRKELGLSLRTPRFNQICAAALLDLLHNADLAKEDLDRQCGIVVASRLGPVAMVSNFQDELLDYPEDQVMAGNFANSVHNAPAGAMTILLDIHGPAYSVMGFEDMLSQALTLVQLSLASSSCKEMLLLTGEEQTLIGEAVRKVHPAFEGEGACAFLFTADPSQGKEFSYQWNADTTAKDLLEACKGK